MKETNKSTASEPGPVLIGGGLMTILFSVEVFVFRNEKSFVRLENEVI